MDKLTALFAEPGPVYVALGDVIGIKPNPPKPGKSPSRAIVLRGGYVFYVLDNDANRAKLAPLLPDDAAAVVIASGGGAKKRGKG